MGFCIGLDAVVLAGIHLDAAISFDYFLGFFTPPNGILCNICQGPQYNYHSMSARTHVPRHLCNLLIFTSLKPNSLVLVLFQVELVSCVNAAAARRAACNLLAFNFPPPINFPPAPRPPRSKSSLSYMMIGRNETCLEKRTLFLLGSPRLKRRPNFTETASSSSSIYSNLCFAVVLALVLGDMCKF